MTLSINRVLNFRPSPPVFRFSPANNTALFAGENRLTVYCGKGCVNSSSCTGGNQSFLFMAEPGSTPRGRCQWIDTACLTQYCISFFHFMPLMILLFANCEAMIRNQRTVYIYFGSTGLWRHSYGCPPLSQRSSDCPRKRH